MDVLSQEKSQLRLNLVLVARLAHFKQPSGNSGGSPLQPLMIKNCLMYQQRRRFASIIKLCGKRVT